MSRRDRNSKTGPRSGTQQPARRHFYHYSRRAIWILALCLTGALVAGLLFWSERRRQNREAATTTEGSIERQELAGANLARIGANVYFRQVGSPTLVALHREIFATASPEVRARQLVQEIIEGPRPEEKDKIVPVLPREAKVRQVYLLKDGTAVVDLSEEAVSLLPGGIDSEVTAIESIRRTILENVTQIKAVRFLVNGKQAETFAGHVALSSGM